MVAWADWEKAGKCQVGQEDVLSDRDGMLTGQFLTDLYHYVGIQWNLSTGYHQPLDG